MHRARHQTKGVGRSLLQDVLVRCAGAAEDVGIRVMLVHAKHERAKAFYLRYGFEVSPTDPLHLLMIVKGFALTWPDQYGALRG